MQDTTPLVLDGKESFYGKLRKPKSKDIRPRKYLFPNEVEKLLKAAKQSGRYGHRDYVLLLVMYRHGLRVGEAVNLLWSQISFESGVLDVNRLKGGIDSVHPLQADELRALRKLKQSSPYVFMTERKSPISTSSVRKIIKRAGEKAGISFPVCPHMLRHSTGHALANKGKDTRSLQVYLGHVNIQHTVGYTAVAANRFKDFWKD